MCHQFIIKISYIVAIQSIYVLCVVLRKEEFISLYDNNVFGFIT
jgi:hypothetical protein